MVYFRCINLKEDHKSLKFHVLVMLLSYPGLKQTVNCHILKAGFGTYLMMVNKKEKTNKMHK